VDDSHIGVTSSHIDDPDLTLEGNIRLHELRVLEDLTKLAQHYERLLWSTGGALNILKCSWVLISGHWGFVFLAMASRRRQRRFSGDMQQLRPAKSVQRQSLQ